MRAPYEPPGHRYPTLAQPVDAMRFGGELGALVREAGFDPRDASVHFLGTLDEEHLEDPRRYAQVIPEQLHFEFSHAALWLPRPQRIGVLAHEVGHVMRPEGGERDADEAAGELGFPISYDLRWPGRGLQTARNLEHLEGQP